jgi:hypothetical protein
MARSNSKSTPKQSVAAPPVAAHGQAAKPNTQVAPAVVTHASNTPSQEQIARRAYELFESRGRTHGRHQEDWLQAERELQLGRQ